MENSSSHNSSIRNWNFIFTAVIFALNAFGFIPMLMGIFISLGGKLGMGWVILPFLIIPFLFLIPAILTFFKKRRYQKLFFAINFTGMIISLVVFSIVFLRNK